MKLEPARNDWIDTLRRIGQCNTVISVDTAVAHLSAGSERLTTLVSERSPRLALASRS